MSERTPGYYVEHYHHGDHGFLTTAGPFPSLAVAMAHVEAEIRRWERGVTPEQFASRWEFYEEPVLDMVASYQYSLDDVQIERQA